MSAALAGALTTAKAANPGARTAAAHAREGQATTARSKKWVGAASRRSAQAALKLRSSCAQAALKLRSRQARGKSRPVEAPCAPLPPSGFEPVAFASRGKRLRHRTIRRSRFCWPANWRDISTWLVLHCSAHAEAATFGQLGLQLENGLVEIFLSMCGTLVLASCGLWASGASVRAAWRWRCCWQSGARVALASQLACT